jgi:hypothetical protein
MGLPPPPRSSVQFPFPGAGGTVFDPPRLCRRRCSTAVSAARPPAAEPATAWMTPWGEPDLKGIRTDDVETRIVGCRFSDVRWCRDPLCS